MAKLWQDKTPDEIAHDLTKAMYYWYKNEAEKLSKENRLFRRVLQLIADFRTAGMSYVDTVDELKEIAHATIDPNYKPILMGRYAGETAELINDITKRSEDESDNTGD